VLGELDYTDHGTTRRILPFDIWASGLSFPAERKAPVEGSNLDSV